MTIFENIKNFNNDDNFNELSKSLDKEITKTMKNLNNDVNFNELSKSSYKQITKTMKNGDTKKYLYKIDVKKQNEEYYLKNKQYLQEKIKCNCGKNIAREYINKHENTKYHINYVLKND